MAIEFNVEFSGGEDEDEDIEEESIPSETPKKKRTRRKSSTDNSIDKLSNAAEKLAQSAASAPPPPPPIPGTSGAIPPTATPFSFKPPKKSEAEKLAEQAEKEFARAVKQQQQQNKREYIAEQQAERRQIKEAAQEEAKAQKEAIRQQQAESQSAVGDIRSAAIAKRVQAYSAASLLGFPGYVGASALDQLVFRKQENEQVAAEKKYQEDLRQYKLQVDADRVAKFRAQEQASRERPITAVNITAMRAAKGLPPLPSGVGGAPPGGIPPTPPNQPPGGLGYPTSSGGGGEEPPSGGGGAMPPGAGTMTNYTGGGGGTPPPVAPTRPTVPQFNGTPFAAATAALLGVQQLNKLVEAGVSNYGQLVGGMTNADASSGVKQSLKSAKSLVDPLGLNLPTTVVVEGFTQLLDISDGILANVQKNLAFSPQTLQASIEGDIAKLFQQINLSQQLDPTTAELVKANTKFEMVWAEFRAGVIEDIGPTIVTLLQTITSFIKVADKFRQADQLEILNFWLPTFEKLFTSLGIIADNTAPDSNSKLDNAGLAQRISDFMNPANYPNPGP